MSKFIPLCTALALAMACAHDTGPAPVARPTAPAPPHRRPIITLLRELLPRRIEEPHPGRIMTRHRTVQDVLIKLAETCPASHTHEGHERRIAAHRERVRREFAMEDGIAVLAGLFGLPERHPEPVRTPAAAD